MTAPALLLFDLGGVLLENASLARLNPLLPVPMAPAAFKERWLRSPAVRSFEIGAIDAATFADAFVQEWQVPLSREAFLAEFASWPLGFYPGARELLARLRQRYRIACLSNSNEVHWARFGGFVDVFELALSSHEIGAIKPDDEAFLLTLTRCGVAPADVVFFDDTHSNVVAARRLGMRACQVEGMAELEAALARTAPH